MYKIKQCLAASQISVEVTDIKIKSLREGSKSTLQDIFVVATLLPKASKMLKLLCNGPSGAHRHLFDLAEIGGIPSKGAYRPRSKVAKLPFNGAKYTPVALVRSALCVTETHGAERAAYMQNQVLIPALVARLDVEIADKQRTLAEHEAKATDASADTAVRQRANDAIVAQSPYLAALGRCGRNWETVSQCSWRNRWRSTRTMLSTLRLTTLCVTTRTRTARNFAGKCATVSARHGVLAPLYRQTDHRNQWC